MRSFVRSLALMTATALAACGGTLSVDDGHLRLVNATSNFAALDLFADDRAVVSGVAPYASSDYASLEADVYSLEVRQPGNAASLATTSTTLPRRWHQTVVAYTSGGTMATTVLDEEEGEPRSGKAKFRVFNTANADAGNVDVYLVTIPCNALETSAVAATASGVGGLQSTYTELSSSATSYNVCVTSAGDRSDLRLEIPAFVLYEERIVTLILARGSGGYLLNGIVLDQQGAAKQALNASARARVAASVMPPTTAVSVEVNGKAISAGLASPNVGPYTLVPAGPVSVEVNDVERFPATPFTAAPGADLTVLLTGSTPTVTLLPDDNIASSSTARPAKLRLVNGLNNSIGTATLTVNNVVIGSGAAPGTASGYSLLAASAGHARVQAIAGGMQIYLKEDVTLEAGHVYSLFLLGDAAGTSKTGILVQDQ